MRICRNKSSGVDGVDWKLVEESLSRLVDLLDACGAVREVLQMMRENVRALQSAMRRKGTDSDSAVQNDVAAYLSFRKRMQKTVAKTLKNLRKSEINHEREFEKRAGFVSYAAERSLVSRLVAGKSRGGVNEIEDLDLGLRGKMRSDVVKKLQIVDDIIGELEGRLERLFRQLIQTRVTLFEHSYPSIMIIHTEY
ncbi:hypothetical protein SASPL_148531 [Salvia splendens]|uniref:Uncharacterized protein n=1 Tax=Salvia splendens TaxID=180675 RepID=A0A8X8WA40_SALSN|nr:hypothetical protein SASPL_148531 [Salvia splendens]